MQPFQDSNWRIRRLLITLLLIERKLLSTPLLYLSTFLKLCKISTIHNLII
ncbi:MAG: hypothetical protein ACR5K2_00870 [Wolbachia sp.]